MRSELKTSRRLAARAAGAAWLFVAATVSIAFPQEGGEPPKPPAGPHGAAEGASGEDQVAEIIRQIEKHMTEAEKLLTGFEAGSATAAHQEAAAELLKKLLDDAGKSQSSALSDIDKLLEIAAKQAKQQSQGGGSSRQRSEEERQAEAERQRQERERLARKDKPKPEGGEGEREGDESQDEKKKGGRKPPDAGQENAAKTDVAGRWGLLPAAIRARIEQGNWSDFPPEYREKLEKWYKRIAAEEK